MATSEQPAMAGSDAAREDVAVEKIDAKATEPKVPMQITELGIRELAGSTAASRVPQRRKMLARK